MKRFVWAVLIILAFAFQVEATTSITTRAGKGSALSTAEMDGNLTNLRDAVDNGVGSLAALISALQQGQAGGTLGFVDKASMDADLVHDANTLARVTNDATASYNAIYIKLGASGTGSWARAMYQDQPFIMGDWYASDLGAAVAARGSTPTTLLYSSDLTLSSNITIPATFELLPINGAVINHTTYTISYAGPTDRWDATQKFNGTGTVSVLKESKPEWWGDNITPGTTDMTAEFQAAYAASPNVILGPGPYLITDTITLDQRFTRIGGADGSWATIRFNPATPKILFHLTGCTVPNSYYGSRDSTISKIFFSSTNLIGKTAIQVEDGQNITLEDLETDNVSWTSTAGTSCGIYLAGRDSILIRRVNLLTEYPIIIAQNTQFYTNTGLDSGTNARIDLDSSHFQDLFLVAQTVGEASSGQANISVNTDVNITGLVLDGYISFAKGSSGFYYANTDVAGDQSFGLSFNNIRYEQGDADGDTYAIYLQSTNNYINDVTINGLHVDNNSQGFYASKVRGLSVKDSIILTPAPYYSYKMTDILSGTFDNLHYLDTTSVDNGTVLAFASSIPYADGDYDGYVSASFGTSVVLPAWNTITPTAPWTEADAVKYLKQNNTVYIKGTVTNGAALNTSAFTLAAGYRPSVPLLFVTGSNNAFGQVLIGTDGTVKPAVGALSNIVLDGISFRTE